MGFWTGVGDWFGLSPVESAGDFFKDAASILTMGAYNPQEGNFNPVRHMNDLGPVAAGAAAAFNEAIDNKVSSTMGGVMDAINTLRENNLGDYAGDLFQTDADAALDQAMTNDALSEAAWKRSEISADKAMERARHLRSTYYEDLARSLKAAGLNPVLAASGGFGGVSSSAPMGTSQAATSQKADGLNAADLITAIAAILNGAGSLLGGVTRSGPAGIITKAGRIGF